MKHQLRIITFQFCLPLVALLLTIPAQAQQEPQYSQYIFNSLIINPAYAGSKGMLNANAIYRSQWTGIDGAPTTATFSLDNTSYSNRIGWGVYVVQDKIGVQSQTNLSGNLAVKLNTGEKSVLSFGLAGEAAYFSYDQNNVRTGTPNDPTFRNSGENKLAPDLKAGFYYHTQKFYVGLSGANLLSYLNDQLLIRPAPNMFLTSGLILDINDYMKLKPSFLIKDDFRSPTNADFNAFLLFYEKLWLGASYRRSVGLWRSESEFSDLELASAMAYMLEFYPADKFRIGYAYDASKSGLNNYGSHEISVGYYFSKPQSVRTMTPRYF